MLVERKLIRNAGCAGHVEDVVVDASARGRGVGKALLDALVAKARALGCYKARCCYEQETWVASADLCARQGVHELLRRGRLHAADARVPNI